MADDTPERALAGAEAALSRFAQGPARDAASVVSGEFEKASQKIASDLARAASNGELSFKRLAKTALEEMAKIAFDQIFGPGPPQGGKRCCCDERSPVDVMTAMSVNFHLGAGADADSIRRNQSQIAAQVARAAAYGKRNQ